MYFWWLEYFHLNICHCQRLFDILNISFIFSLNTSNFWRIFIVNNTFSRIRELTVYHYTAFNIPPPSIFFSFPNILHSYTLQFKQWKCSIKGIFHFQLVKNVLNDVRELFYDWDMIILFHVIKIITYKTERFIISILSDIFMFSLRICSKARKPGYLYLIQINIRYVAK